MFDIIQYKNMSFPSRKLYVDGWGDVLISTLELQDQLLNESGTDYKDSTAQIIDEKIFYFVEHTQIRIPEEDLREILERELNL